MTLTMTSGERCPGRTPRNTFTDIRVLDGTGQGSQPLSIGEGNHLWVAKQHGHSVEVMLRMYAAWLEGATEADIHAIKKAMEKTPVVRATFLDSRTAISAVNAVSNRVTQIVIRPLKSPKFGSREKPE
jgi:hypothetical protein